MESGDRLMCWMYLRSSGSICTEIFSHKYLYNTIVLKVYIYERVQYIFAPCKTPNNIMCPLYSITHLVGEQRDETFGFSLQVQVHVKQLPIESLVNLLLPLHPTGLLHGPLHTLPVQVTGQVTQENAHVLRVVQGDAELAESEEEQKRRNRGWRWRKKKEKKQGYREVEGRGASVND